MKNIVMLFAVVFSCVLLTGCGDKPEKVVIKFSKAVKKHDYKTASECMVNVSESDIKDMCKEDKTGYKSLSSMKPVAVEIDGNEAKVTVEMITELKVPLKKVNGVWKIKR